MATAQEQFADFAQRGQESLTKALQDWADSVRDYTLSVTDSTRPPDPKEAVEHAFDLAERLLRTQRGLVTDLLTATGKAAEATAEAAAEAARDAAERLASAGPTSAG